jgi:hypothetical protein
MMRNVLQIRTQLLTVIMAGVAGVGLATGASAASVGAGVKANVGAGAQVAPPDTAQAGGSADAHMSTSGSANTNAQWQSGATRGADRAAERLGTTSEEAEQTAPTDLEAATAKAKRSGTR